MSKGLNAMQLAQDVYGEEAMESLGTALSSVLQQGGVVFLEGDLGMGKTTLVRGVLKGLGYDGPVKSPTYTLVEPYELVNLDAYHFDLYRVGDPEELEFMGVRDYFTDQSLCLIEWAEMGRGILPDADLVVSITLLSQGRHLTFTGQTEKGAEALMELGARLTP
ncbi:tRNA (adenosine(37)-N6)-threonylcarbamoyltransferase complex ATPase subunit type 1 TsaE [Marinomonas algarum]|uniref:tRNA threonylcarbamoyladenosine biosynthesis protein TsaE n=1 Tax=Marinomonas algarum TaxID=2883105 RepID=A0A9X1IP83_9GAMM|nr:tRNA (adenosine(37)-N6)-threonylcarbamoyltransferase complex ATPase subunit type 1 TsaE [Marinomonas algarum]MCB5161393.1 tRNA (adenosine(37)-N6)-threonylcarbamoyltransferase complex ATPase subunit type 1 TsaE [Marinomonas algarum]